MQVEQTGLAHAFVVEVDDKPVPPGAFVTHLNRFLAQIHGAFVFLAVDGEDVGLAYFARILDKENLLGDFVVTQKPEPLPIQVKAIKWCHLNPAVVLGVVLIFNPALGGLVERIKTGKVQVLGKKSVSKASEKAFDFAFGRAVTNRRMGQTNIEPHTGLQNLLGRVVGAVVKIQPLGLAALKQGGSKGVNHIPGVVPIEELSVGNHPAGIVNKGDQEGLTPGAIGLFDRGAVHGIGLPQLIGKLHGKGLAQLLGLRLLEQVVLPHHAVKRRLRQLRAAEVVSRQELSVQRHLGDNPGFVEPQVRQHLVNGLGKLIELDLAVSVFVGSGFFVQTRDAVFFKPVAPGFDGAPGELIHMAGGRIDEGAPADAFDALTGAVPGGVIDGAEDAQSQLQRWIGFGWGLIHGFSPGMMGPRSLKPA